MRAPRRLIPTEYFWISAGFGALIPLSMLVIGFLLGAKEILTAMVLLSPFVCGFSAGVVFGRGASGRHAYRILLGIVGYLLFMAGLIALGLIFGKRGETFYFVIYMHFLFVFFFPPFIFAPFFASALGALVGRQVARAIQR